uniref:galactose-specific lectin nattectin-like n=1 Tax=Doryrhamphus excisus TaxID=161450 RepID=UPI0025AE2CB0|nr:galactose-specific lectin nattectin-like [Doryrhamphus excisus]
MTLETLEIFKSSLNKYWAIRQRHKRSVPSSPEEPQAMASGHFIVLFLFVSGGVFLGEAARQSDKECPRYWTKYLNKCLAYIPQNKKWIEGEIFCQHLKGNLASFHTEDELRFLMNMVSTSSLTWVGAHDHAEEDTWLWTDGSVFEPIPWGMGQPDNWYDGENCMEIHWQGRTNDAACNLLKPFICQRDIDIE